MKRVELKPKREFVYKPRTAQQVKARPGERSLPPKQKKVVPFHYEPRPREGISYQAWKIDSVKKAAKRAGFEWEEMLQWKRECEVISARGFWLIPADAETIEEEALSPVMQTILGTETLNSWNLTWRNKSQVCVWSDKYLIMDHANQIT